MANTNFADLLVDFRRRHGLSQTQLAEHLGMYRGTIVRWEQQAALPRITQRRSLVDQLGEGDAQREAALCQSLGMAVRAAPAEATPADPEVLLMPMRAIADELDVTAQRFRVAALKLLVAIDRLGLSAATAVKLLS